LWKEENGGNLKPPTDAAAEMRGAGITPGGIAGDMGAQDAEAPEDMAAAAEGSVDANMGAEAAPAQPPAQV